MLSRPMTEVTCETCGDTTISDRCPCVNCDSFPVVSDWSGSFRFDQALRGMRMGKRVRRKAKDDQHWSIENGKLMWRWPDPDGDDAVMEACEIHEGDILADDWEVVT